MAICTAVVTKSAAAIAASGGIIPADGKSGSYRDVALLAPLGANDRQPIASARLDMIDQCSICVGDAHHTTSVDDTRQDQAAAQRAGAEVKGSAAHFTAPMLRPRTRYFCSTRTSTSTGAVARMPAAESLPQSTARKPTYCVLI